MELTIVCVDKVSKVCMLCDALDILHIDGIHRALGALEGPLEICENLIARLIGGFNFYLQKL